MKRISIILLALLLFGCSAEKKRLRQVEKAKIVAYQNPKDFAEFCATVYPVKDSIGEPIIKYVKADNKEYSDTIDSLISALNRINEKVEKDTTASAKVYKNEIANLSKQLSDFKKAYKPCIPDTVFRDNVIYKENTAKIVDLTNKLASVSEELKQSKLSDEKHEKLAQKRLFWIVGLMAFIACYFIFLKKFF